MFGESSVGHLASMGWVATEWILALAVLLTSGSEPPIVTTVDSGYPLRSLADVVVIAKVMGRQDPTKILIQIKGLLNISSHMVH